MTTRTVYRVEHETEGYGPYLKMGTSEWSGEQYSETHEEVEGLHDAHESSDDHPGPRMDGLSWERTQDHVFGFDSRKDVDKWFKGFKRKLRAAGFVVRTYETPEDDWYPGDSGKQCIFRRDLSRVVDTNSVIGYRNN